MGKRCLVSKQASTCLNLYLGVDSELTPNSDCDSPMALVNYTFDWLKKEWADEVDFVIWTGDNARSVDDATSRPRRNDPKSLSSLHTPGTISTATSLEHPKRSSSSTT